MKMKCNIVIMVGILLLATSTLAGINTSFSEKNESPGVPLHSLLPQREDYDMVIIAPEQFSADIHPLIEHKNSHGVRTFLKTTEEIYGEFQGRDKAEQVKYFIKDAIEHFGITYVLLIGGRQGQSFTWYVPVRYSHVEDGVMHTKFLSDLYFADIYKEDGTFESWDSDGNGIFSEWKEDAPVPGDIVDLTPDVYLGRLPCRNQREVRTIVDKIIQYENTAHGAQWVHNIVLIGGDTVPGVGEPFPYEGEVDTTWVLNYLDGFDATTLFLSDGTLTGPDDIIDAINAGCGFVYYGGHGWPYRWATHMPDDDEWTNLFNNRHISQLDNDGMYPIVVAGCCLTTEFDVALLNFMRPNDYILPECAPRCFGWQFVRQSNGGAIGYIAQSSTSWGEVGDKDDDGIPDGAENGYSSGICNEFFKVFGEGKHVLGEIHGTAVTNYVETFPVMQNNILCKCVQEWILLGDPSLKIGGYP